MQYSFVHHSAIPKNTFTVTKTSHNVMQAKKKKWKSLIKELLLLNSAEHSSVHCLICKSVGVAIKTNVFFVFLETFKRMKGHVCVCVEGVFCFCFSFVFDREFKSEHKFPVCPHSHMCVTELLQHRKLTVEFSFSFSIPLRKYMLFSYAYYTYLVSNRFHFHELPETADG